MQLPESLFQLLVLLVLVVPGIVFTYVRRWLRGPSADERDFSVRLVHAVAASVIFDCIYLIFVGPFLVQMFTTGAGEPSALTQPRAAGFFTLVLAVAIPSLVALAQLLDENAEPQPGLLLPARLSTSSSRRRGWRRGCWPPCWLSAIASIRL